MGTLPWWKVKNRRNKQRISNFAGGSARWIGMDSPEKIAERKLGEFLDKVLTDLHLDTRDQESLDSDSSQVVRLSSADAVAGDCQIQDAVESLRTTTFWEFRVQFMYRLADLLVKHRRVLQASTDIIVDALNAIAERLEDWNQDVRLAAVRALEAAAKAEDSAAIDALLGRLEDHVETIREAAEAALIEVAPRDKENFVAKLAALMENPSQNVRNSALVVFRVISPWQHLVQALSKLLQSSRADVRVWAAHACNNLASDLPAPSRAPSHHSQKPGEPNSNNSQSQAVDAPQHSGKASSQREEDAQRGGGGNAEEDPLPKTAHQPARASSSSSSSSSALLDALVVVMAPYIHDESFQVQRAALHILFLATLGSHRFLVARACKDLVPVASSTSDESIIAFITALHTRTSHIATDTIPLWQQARVAPDQAQRRVREAEDDIALTVDIHNTLNPGIGEAFGSSSSPSHVRRGVIEMPADRRASPTRGGRGGGGEESPPLNSGGYGSDGWSAATDNLNGSSAATGNLNAGRLWVPDYGVRESQLLLVGPARTLVQVGSVARLHGGLDIFAADRYGNVIHLPANSPLPEHQWILASSPAAASVRTLPVVSSVSLRQLPPQGHRASPVAGFALPSSSLPSSSSSRPRVPHRGRGPSVGKQEGREGSGRGGGGGGRGRVSGGPGILEWLTTLGEEEEREQRQQHYGAFQQDLVANRRYYTEHLPLHHGERSSLHGEEAPYPFSSSSRSPHSLPRGRRSPCSSPPWRQSKAKPSAGIVPVFSSSSNLSGSPARRSCPALVRFPAVAKREEGTFLEHKVPRVSPFFRFRPLSPAVKRVPVLGPTQITADLLRMDLVDMLEEQRRQMALLNS